MEEVLQNELIRNMKWERSGRETKILSFDVSVHGKLYTIKLQGANIAQQLQELQKGSRILGHFSCGETDTDIWKLPKNRYRLECHLDSDTQLTLILQDKEMDKLFGYV